MRSRWGSVWATPQCISVGAVGKAFQNHDAAGVATYTDAYYGEFPRKHRENEADERNRAVGSKKNGRGEVLIKLPQRQ